MRKKLSTMQAREKFGEVLDQAYYRGDEFIIERRGKPLAVIVPFEEYQKWQRRREEGFKVYERLWKAHKEFSAEEVEKDVSRTVQAVRRAKR